MNADHPNDWPALYHPPGMWAQDFWFIKHGDTYHTFYDQYPRCLVENRRKFERVHIGHASSTDLVHWTNHGPALVPIQGTWNDRFIATGTVLAHEGRWWLFFFGGLHYLPGAFSERLGIGLAVSDDLMEWRKIGDKPVAPMGPEDRFEGVWKGNPCEWFGVSDPFVYPEPIDGWFYMALTARVVGVPLSRSGCVATMRSRDLKTWEPHKVLSFPGWFDRMEVPKIWYRNDRWYLIIGGVCTEENLPDEAGRLDRIGNYVFTSDRFGGPYQATGQWRITLPDGKTGQEGYIATVLPGPDGQDVMLLHSNWQLSRPYPVSYAADGSLVLGMPGSRTVAES